jgi:hypothetical protein
VWRWAVAVWAVAVVGGGILTLWLQASAEPPPTGWYTSEQDGRDGREAPAPLLSIEPSTLPCPGKSDGKPVLCLYATGP